MITNCNNLHVDCMTSDFIGLSTDVKPTDVNNASVFYEMDTGNVFMYDAQNKKWLQQ